MNRAQKELEIQRRRERAEKREKRSADLPPTMYLGVFAKNRKARLKVLKSTIWQAKQVKQSKKKAA